MKRNCLDRVHLPGNDKIAPTSWNPTQFGCSAVRSLVPYVVFSALVEASSEPRNQSVDLDHFIPFDSFRYMDAYPQNFDTADVAFILP